MEGGGTLEFKHTQQVRGYASNKSKQDDKEVEEFFHRFLPTQE